jgi:hypothetical protein
MEILIIIIISKRVNYGNSYISIIIIGRTASVV